MSEKYLYSLVTCNGCNSYTTKGFHVRRGQEIQVNDPDLVDELKNVSTLSVRDVFDQEPEQDHEDTKKVKKGK